MVFVAAAEHAVDAVSGVIGNVVMAAAEPTLTEFQPPDVAKRDRHTSVGIDVVVIVKFVLAPWTTTVPLSE